MIDPDRPFRDQDPLDQNARSGAEDRASAPRDLELSTRKTESPPPASWRSIRCACRLRPLLSLLDAQDRDHAARAVQESIDTGNFDVQYRVHYHLDEHHAGYAVGTTINGPDGALPGSAAS